MDVKTPCGHDILGANNVPSQLLRVDLDVSTDMSEEDVIHRVKVLLQLLTVILKY